MDFPLCILKEGPISDLMSIMLLLQIVIERRLQNTCINTSHNSRMRNFNSESQGSCMNSQAFSFFAPSPSGLGLASLWTSSLLQLHLTDLFSIHNALHSMRFPACPQPCGQM